MQWIFTLKTFILPLIDAQQNAGFEVTSVCSRGKYTEGMRNAGYAIESISITVLEKSYDFKRAVN